MKRDMELYRKILREVETWPTTCSPKEVEIEGFTQDQIGYHAWMLAEEGLLDGLDMTGADYPVHVYSPRCLTPKGHDFLEVAQDDTRWKKAKDAIMERGLPLTVKVLGMVLQEYVKGEVRKFTGTG